MFIAKRFPRKTNKCDRCTLRYLTKRYEQCPHCSELDDAGLKVLFIRIEEERITSAAFGRKMLIGAVVACLAAFIIAVSVN